MSIFELSAVNIVKSLMRYILLLFIYIWAFPAASAEADVINAEVIPLGNDRYTFRVTVKHPDTGWDHFADRWEVLTLERELITGRVLRHPHVDEQPFTRSLPNVVIPEEINEVIIRAHCSMDKFGGQEIFLNIPNH